MSSKPGERIERTERVIMGPERLNRLLYLAGFFAGTALRYAGGGGGDGAAGEVAEMVDEMEGELVWLAGELHRLWEWEGQRAVRREP